MAYNGRAMEPRIQYAQTEDGVSIAFATMGEGIPLVCMPRVPWGHIQLELQLPGLRHWHELLAKKWTVVRYDSRGTGLSDRNAIDFSLDAQLLDLEAVMQRLALERVALLGVVFSGTTAVAYATRHPQRVSHLVLWCSGARGADMQSSPQMKALQSLMMKDYELAAESATHFIFRYSDAERAHQVAEFMRECASHEAVRAFLRASNDTDVTALLPDVKVPTLVMHRRQVIYPSLQLAQELTSQIPDARLVVLEGDSATISEGDIESVRQAIDEFLGEGEEAPPTAELPEGMAVLLFADIAESTALTEQLGDSAFRAKARELDTSLRSIIGDSGGTPIEGKVLGDGVLAVFTSARQAIDCALRCEAAGEPLGLRLHLGIHAGDVIREGNNVYGGAVNIAARIAAASEPGEVLVSDTVRSLGRTSADVTFDDRGEHTLKGVGEPQRLFAVRGGG